MESLKEIFIPELGTPYKGKVREVYDCQNELLLMATDRISIFDRELPEGISDKGRVLTGLSQFWFDQTKMIAPNHFVSRPAPQAMLVKKCKPIPIEVIVRGYMTGSMWRDYASGKRHKCGIPLPEGLKEHDPLPHPIVTPTTKAPQGEHDEDISKEELIKRKVVSVEYWNQIESTALALYKRGNEIIHPKNLILVDTKYEFGIDTEGNLLLIDEVHTPDSSRYWFRNDYETREIKFPDKEMVREWARKQGFNGEGPAPHIPIEMQRKIRENYRNVYELITGLRFEDIDESPTRVLLKHLKESRLIKGKFALILMGSEKDQPHADKITDALNARSVGNKTIVASAHKHTHKVMDILEKHQHSLEPMVFITLAGRSNALSGVVAANTKWPVIACPPFKDQSDYLVNIHSTLQMPSEVPVMTVLDPGNAALAAEKILRLAEVSG
jgi:fusion protein PurCD